MSLPLQPLDFKDFSGGMTDNYFQSDIRRFQYADNYLITVDKKLDVRYGTLIFDSVGYRLPSGNQRVNSLFSFINETILLGQSGTQVFEFPGSAQAWVEILSPDGTHPAIPVNDTTSQVTTAEFQHQLYMTTDYNNGQLPVKLYQDGSNTWRSVTAGLPRTNEVGISNWLSATLLAKCITNANLLKAAMVAHLASTTQHQSADPAGTTLNAVANATNFANLQTLMTALAMAYEEHRYDLAGPSPFVVSAPPAHTYHFATAYGAMSLKLSQTPNVVAKAAENILDSAAVQLRNAYKYSAAFLDDLLVKFNWHIQTPTGHESAPTQYAFTGWTGANATAHLVATSNLIGTITEGEPLVLPNYNGFIDMITYLRAVYNGHVQATGSNSQMHTRRDFFSICPIVAPTDFYSAVSVLMWLRFTYGFSHSADLNQITLTRLNPAPTTVGTMSTTNGSATATAVTLPGLLSTVSLSPAQPYTFNPIDTGNALDSYYANINGVGGTPGAYTLVFDRVMQQTATGVPVQCIISALHTFNILGQLADPPNGWVQNQNQILFGNATQGAPPNPLNVYKVVNPGTFSVPADPYDLKSWNGFAEEFALAFGEHIFDPNIHPLSDYLDTEAYFVKGSVTLLDGNDFYIPTIVSYSYAFQYQHNYTVNTNGLQYLVNSNPVITNSIETCQPYVQGDQIPSLDINVYSPKVIETPTYAGQISNIPELTNSGTTNYDLANIINQIYRTTDGGNTYYLVADLTLAISTYTDYTSDQSSSPNTAALVDNETLYTNGGVVGADQPPVCKYIHYCNGYAYYGGITEVSTDIGGDVVTQYLPNRLVQAVDLAPDWAPGSFTEDFDDAIVGINSFRSIPIVFCSNSIFRIENNFTETGQGFISQFKISENIGALNAKSIVKTEVGLFYAATDGFYYTDGYQIIKVSLDLDKTYQNNTQTPAQKQRIYGSYDKHNRRVYWSMIDNDVGTEPTELFVYYLNYGVKPSGVFTEIYANSNSWVASSNIWWNGQLVIGDSRGYIFKSDENTQSDPIVNTGTNPSTWGITWVPYFYASTIFDFGSAYKKKYTPKIRFLGKNIGNAYIDIAIVNDADALGYGYRYCTPIKYIPNTDSEDPGDGRIDMWRRFPAGSLKSNLKQLIVQPSTRVFSYDETGVTSFTKAVLSQGGGNNVVTLTATTWPALTESDQLSIAFDIDEYVTRFPIINYAFAGGQITVKDVNTSFANFIAMSGGVSFGLKVFSGLTVQRHNLSNMIVQFSESVSDVGDYGKDEGGTQTDAQP